MKTNVITYINQLEAFAGAEAIAEQIKNDKEAVEYAKEIILLRNVSREGYLKSIRIRHEQEENRRNQLLALLTE
jgi:hypothetical protein